MRGFANRCEDYEKCITACISEIIKKAVQENYSGKGRKTKISQKEIFSATLTYKCLEGKFYINSINNAIKFIVNLDT